MNPSNAFLPFEGTEDTPRNDPESRRIRRVAVKYDRVVVADFEWESKSRLTPTEQQALADAFYRIVRLPLPWFSSRFSRRDASIVKDVFPEFRVYFEDEEVL